MMNKAFSQLTTEEKLRKLDRAIRSQADKLLSAEQIEQLVRRISPDRQYRIVIHPIKRKTCEALILNDVLHIYVAEEISERN